MLGRTFHGGPQEEPLRAWWTEASEQQLDISLKGVARRAGGLLKSFLEQLPVLCPPTVLEPRDTNSGKTYQP